MQKKKKKALALIHLEASAENHTLVPSVHFNTDKPLIMDFIQFQPRVISFDQWNCLWARARHHSRFSLSFSGCIPDYNKNHIHLNPEVVNVHEILTQLKKKKKSNAYCVKTPKTPITVGIS